jgi:predicted GH43/DUF377 family glycosyl hydrolase
VFGVYIKFRHKYFCGHIYVVYTATEESGVFWVTKNFENWQLQGPSQGSSQGPFVLLPLALKIQKKIT